MKPKENTDLHWISEEQKAFVSKLNVIDDVFFQKMAEDREVAEEMLRIILEKPKLKVIDSKVQRFLRNIGAHSVVLDLICEDENHKLRSTKRRR